MGNLEAAAEHLFRYSICLGEPSTNVHVLLDVLYKESMRGIGAGLVLEI